MADALTTITKFINSPPGVLAAGGVLAGAVWKSFERVEAVLKDDSKLEIAVLLLSVKSASAIAGWTRTLATLSDRVFGKRLFSVTAFRRSTVVSLATLAFSAMILYPNPAGW